MDEVEVEFDLLWRVLGGTGEVGCCSFGLADVRCGGEVRVTGSIG